MPTQKKDTQSGAVIFVPTVQEKKERQRRIELKKEREEVSELKKELKELIEDLKSQ